MVLLGNRFPRHPLLFQKVIGNFGLILPWMNLENQNHTTTSNWDLCKQPHPKLNTKQSSLLSVGQIEPEHSHGVVKNQLLRIKDGKTKLLLAPFLQEHQELILDRLELVLQQWHLKAGLKKIGAQYLETFDPTKTKPNRSKVSYASTYLGTFDCLTSGSIFFSVSSQWKSMNFDLDPDNAQAGGTHARTK